MIPQFNALINGDLEGSELSRDFPTLTPLMRTVHLAAAERFASLQEGDPFHPTVHKRNQKELVALRQDKMDEWFSLSQKNNLPKADLPVVVGDLLRFFNRNNPHNWQLVENILPRLQEGGIPHLASFLQNLATQNRFTHEEQLRVREACERFISKEVEGGNLTAIHLLRIFDDTPFSEPFRKQFTNWLSRYPQLLTQQFLRDTVLAFSDFPQIWQGFCHHLPEEVLEDVFPAILSLWPDLTLTEQQKNCFRPFFRKNIETNLRTSIRFVHFFPNDKEMGLPSPEALEEWRNGRRTSFSLSDLYWMAQASPIHIDWITENIDRPISELRSILTNTRSPLLCWYNITNFFKLLAIVPKNCPLQDEDHQFIKWAISHSLKQMPHWNGYSKRLTYEFLLHFSKAIDNLTFDLSITNNFTEALESAFKYALNWDRRLDLLEAIASLLDEYPKMFAPTSSILEELGKIMGHPWAGDSYARVAHAFALIEESEFPLAPIPRPQMHLFLQQRIYRSLPVASIGEKRRHAEAFPNPPDS